MTEARIFDRTYRPYEGPRTGVSGAVRSVMKVTAQRALGLRRPARAKVFPILAVVLAYVPTMIYVGITVIGNRLEREGAPGKELASGFIPSYAGSYLQIVLAVVVFAAFVAPEVLSTDMRTGMLGIYLSSPLTRTTYLAAKAATTLALISAVTIGPALLLLIGYTTQGFGPSGFLGWISTLARIVGAGLAVSLLYTMLSLAVSALTPRKAAASAAFLAVVVGTAGLVGYLVVAGGQSTRWGLVNLSTLPYEAVFRVFGEPSPIVLGGESELPTGLVFGAYAAWVLGCAAVIVHRYRTVAVTR